MKRVLIFGKNSYIGNCLAEHLSRQSERYVASVFDSHIQPKKNDFIGYDALVYVAGVAHIKETNKSKASYYIVNRDLAHEVALIAKSAALPHFIYLSSMSVYGLTKGHITINTPENPNTHYGRSKWEAERLINGLADERFTVTILRPPMVYGPNCKGNYRHLGNLAARVPIFPDWRNERSVVSVFSLCDSIERAIEDIRGGLLFPQDREYMDTSRTMVVLADSMGKRLRLSKKLTVLVPLLMRISRRARRMLSSLTYDRQLPK